MIWSAPCWATASATASPSSAISARPTRRARAASRLAAPRIAVVHGDALDAPEQRDLLRQRLGGALDGLDVVSATAYLGAAEIAQALVAGAQIVVAGRVADPSLTLGPALAHFGWDAADWPRLGRATIAGHMLECGLQVTGGYFSVPGLKDVPDLHQAGFPIAEIQSDGEFVIGRPTAPAAWSMPARAVDPARYLTPDVTADLSQARVVELGADRVAVQGVTGHARPDELKVNVCYRGGWLAEAEFPTPACRPKRVPGRRRTSCAGAWARRCDYAPISSAWSACWATTAATCWPACLKAGRATCACAWPRRTPSALRPNGCCAK